MTCSLTVVKVTGILLFFFKASIISFSNHRPCLERYRVDHETGIFDILIDNFTVVRLVAWPLNEGEAGVDPALINLLLFLC